MWDDLENIPWLDTVTGREVAGGFAFLETVGPRHPAATQTVANPHGLVAALDRKR